MTQPPPSRLLYAALLVVSAASMLLELALTRLLSVSLWYHFAFMVVSTALFGFGLAAVVLSIWPGAQRVPLRLYALACPVAFLAAYFLYNLIPFEPFSLGRDGWQWLWLGLCYLAATLPFFCSGLAVASMLTRHAGQVHRLYLFDLAGAAWGGLLIAPVLRALGGAGSVFLAAALAALAAALLFWPRRWPLALPLVLAALSPLAEQWFGVRISSDKLYGKVLRDPQRLLYTAWNSISRIDVIRNVTRRGEQREILIDAGTALTRLAHSQEPLEKLLPGEGDEDFFYRRFNRPRALVVGSGGGREVLMALRNGAERVTAVEINPDINRLVVEIMADFTGRLYSDPRVEWHTDEARSFLRRRAERWHLIHLPHTISNAALSSGSLSLAENYLLTREAFDDFFARLTPDGVLLITRPEAHLPRLLVTARAALEKHAPADLARQVLIWKRPQPGFSFYGGFALGRQPFSPEEIDAFKELLDRQGLQAIFLPGKNEDPFYRQLITSATPEKLTPPFATLLYPARDDRPFFNQRREFSEIGLEDLRAVFSAGREGRLALEDRPVAEAALLALLLESALVAGVLLALPWWAMRRQQISRRRLGRRLLPFFLLGLGYIVVEVGLIQRFSLFLGKPVLVFAVVLGTLLFASGLGSQTSGRFASPRAPVLAAVAVTAASAAACWLYPPLASAALAWPEAARILFCIALVFPLGFLMGMPFPLLFERLAQQPLAVRSWAWGINGFASVLGSIGSVILGMAAGYTVVMVLGMACYLAVAAAVFFLPASEADDQ